MSTPCQSPAFPHRCPFSPPAAGVKAGRRTPAGLGLDPGEDGGSLPRRERPPTRSWSPNATSRQPRSNPQEDQLDKITHIMPMSGHFQMILRDGAQVPP
jgi:hypothetical protein